LFFAEGFTFRNRLGSKRLHVSFPNADMPGSDFWENCYAELGSRFTHPRLRLRNKRRAWSVTVPGSFTVINIAQTETENRRKNGRCRWYWTTFALRFRGRKHSESMLRNAADRPSGRSLLPINNAG
jgi:hypothetical protein